jgi:phage terminase small subunit
VAGRRPKSAALKLVTGNPGHRPISEDEPQAVSGRPEKPPKLGKIASEEWERLADLLDGELRLGRADGPHLTGAATAYETALEFQRRARQRGLPHDEWRRFKTGERMQWDTYRKFINDLCLSQGTRARASKGGGRGKQTSKLEGFLGRRAQRAPRRRRLIRSRRTRRTWSSGAVVAGRAVRLACAASSRPRAPAHAGVPVLLRPGEVDDVLEFFRTYLTLDDVDEDGDQNLPFVARCAGCNSASDRSRLEATWRRSPALRRGLPRDGEGQHEDAGARRVRVYRLVGVNRTASRTTRSA